MITAIDGQGRGTGFGAFRAINADSGSRLDAQRAEQRSQAHESTIRAQIAALEVLDQCRRQRENSHDNRVGDAEFAKRKLRLKIFRPKPPQVFRDRGYGAQPAAKALAEHSYQLTTVLMLELSAADARWEATSQGTGLMCRPWRRRISKASRIAISNQAM